MNRAYTYSAAAPAAGYPSLPSGMERSDLERLLTRSGDALGLSSATLRILLVMIQFTRPSDWTSGHAAPVCFAQQTLVAETCRRSTRAVRSAEQKLCDSGIIIRRIGNGGSRGRWGDFTQGLDFSPLIAQASDLVRLDTERAAVAKKRTVLRKQISAARRMVRAVLVDLFALDPTNGRLPELQHKVGAWARRYDALPVPALAALLKQTESLYRAASAELAAQSETSGLLDENDRPLQEQIEDQTCSCNPEPIAPAEKPKGCHQAQPEECLEQGTQLVAALDPKALASFTPRNLYQAASPEFRLYLDGYSTAYGLDPLTFTKAAISRCDDLRISGAAWAEAAATMGDFAAALAVLVIDARITDPVRPVHSPGGTLRAFIRHSRAGTLNLAGSLIGLIGRTSNAAS